MSPNEAPDQRRAHALMAAVLALTALTAALHALGAGPGRGWLWGTHAYAFLPSFWLPVALLALGGGVAAAWRVGRGTASPAPTARALPALPAPPAPRARWRGPVALAAASVAAGVVFWLARVRHVILGDGSVLIVSLAGGERFHPRQPLAAMLQHVLYRHAGGLFGAGRASPPDVAQMTAALGSVLAGVLAVPFVWLLGREVAELAADGPRRTRQAAAVAAVLLLTQGYALLYFGYVENYTWHALALTACLGLSLRALRRRSSLLPPALALGLAILLHLSGVILLPAFAVVVVTALRRQVGRRAAVRDLLVATAAGAAALAALSRLGNGYSLFGALADVGREVVRGDGQSPPGYLLSGSHLRDFIDEELLIGPLGLFLFLPAAAIAVVRGRRARAPLPAPAVFLLAAGVLYAAASWVAGESNLGYARNWDLLAPSGVVFAAAGLGLFLAADRRLARAWPALLCAVPLSLFHLAPWVAVNASFDRSFARLQTLPSAGGITEANVARWYLIRGEPEAARHWLDAALARNPNANNAHYMLGLMAMEQGDYAAAVRSLGRAVELRPDKAPFREALARALLAAHRWPQAAQQARALLDQEPQEGRIWGYLGMAQIGSGQSREGRQALDRFRELAPADTATAHVVARFYQQAGNDAYGAGRRPAAEAAWREALCWHDDLPGACYNLAALLLEEDRPAEARPFLARWLQLAPNDPDAPRLRRLLAALEAARGAAPAGAAATGAGKEKP